MLTPTSLHGLAGPQLGGDLQTQPETLHGGGLLGVHIHFVNSCVKAGR